MGFKLIIIVLCKEHPFKIYWCEFSSSLQVDEINKVVRMDVKCGEQQDYVYRFLEGNTTSLRCDLGYVHIATL